MNRKIKLPKGLTFNGSGLSVIDPEPKAAEAFRRFQEQAKQKLKVEKKKTSVYLSDIAKVAPKLKMTELICLLNLFGIKITFEIVSKKKRAKKK